MEQDISKMNLINKMAAIRKMSQSVYKAKKGFGYSYVGIDDLLAKITSAMDKYGVTLIPEIDNESASVELVTASTTKFAKDGTQYVDTKNEMLTKIPITYTWINNDNIDDRISIKWFATGSQSDPSMSLGSAASYAMRQMLMNVFQVAAMDTDDPNAFRAKQQEALEAENRMVCDGIIDSVDDLIRGYLESHPDKKDEIKDTVKQHIKVGGKASFNFKQCTDPAMLASLLDALTERYSDTSAE